MITTSVNSNATLSHHHLNSMFLYALLDLYWLEHIIFFVSKYTNDHKESCGLGAGFRVANEATPILKAHLPLYSHFILSHVSKGRWTNCLMYILTLIEIGHNFSGGYLHTFTNGSFQRMINLVCVPDVSSVYLRLHKRGLGKGIISLSYWWPLIESMAKPSPLAPQIGKRPVEAFMKILLKA